MEETSGKRWTAGEEKVRVMVRVGVVCLDVTSKERWGRGRKGLGPGVFDGTSGERKTVGEGKARVRELVASI